MAKRKMKTKAQIKAYIAYLMDKVEAGNALEDADDEYWDAVSKWVRDDAKARAEALKWALGESNE